MYTIHTQLHHFRYNSFHTIGPHNVIWYKLNDKGDGVPLSNEESLALTDYFANNKINFTNQNRHICGDDDSIYCGGFGKPKNQLMNVIVRKLPDLPAPGFIPKCVDIKLCDGRGTPNHSYSLEFDIIGEVL